MDPGRPTVPPILRLLDGLFRHVKASARIPNMPGEDPGGSVTFTLEIQIIGLNSLGQKRQLQITFDVVKMGWYDIYDDTEIETRYRDFVETVGPELAHNSDEWACLECGLPAVDIAWMSVYSKQSHERCTILISAGCKGCAVEMQNSVPKIVSEIHNQRRGRGADDDNDINTIPRPSALSGRLSTACLTCRKDPATSGMSRCGKCKLARYCSADCQTQDWTRHKTVCGKIRAVSRTSDGADEEGGNKA
ncbi:hypothetical protein C8R45DRAFT_970095 [Mycena sanguinolenta]|nr:hypothetical protein C8R45DRAFT_970095 [Mycena sanguinolenta]